MTEAISWWFLDWLLFFDPKAGGYALSETSTDFYRTTWRYKLEDPNLHTYRRENPKSKKLTVVCWVMLLCNFAGAYQCFDGAYCHYHKGSVSKDPTISVFIHICSLHMVAAGSPKILVTPMKVHYSIAQSASTL
jgi:hypothetical protein